MGLALLAQVSLPSTIKDWAILIVVILAVGGIVVVFARRAEWKPPDWFLNIVWIVLAAIVAIVGIIIVVGFANGKFGMR